MDVARSRARRRVLMIGLDAADPEVVERWMEDGTLPHLAALRRRGVFGRLASSAKYVAGSPWPTFYTGQPPSEHGLYHDFQWRHERLQFAAPDADWLPVEPFWRHLAGDIDTVVYDVPFTPGCQAFHGIEVSGWATHDKLAPPQSYPPDLADTIRERFGEWQISYEPYGRSTIAELLDLRKEMLENTRRSAELALWLLQNPWQLAIVCFSALHRGGHRLWDRSSIQGDVSEAEGALFDAAMRDLYMACDRAVGDLVGAADATILVFSLHGMMPNTSRVDLLDDMLARVLGGEEDRTARQGLVRRMGEMLPQEALRWVAKHIPRALRNRAMTIWSAGGIDWDKTQAFSCRADLQGYVRVNLKGREPRGIVAPGREYEVLCERIADGLASFRDADTGEPIIEEVVRIDQIYSDGTRRDRLPDLMVCWKDAPAARHRALSSERFGRIERATPGQIPNGRSANHRGEGMLFLCGDGIAASGPLSGDADILDLAPTVVDLLGAECRMPLRGRSLAGRVAVPA